MPDPKAVQSQFYIEIDGAPVPIDFMNDIQLLTIDSSLHLPDSASITLNDPTLKWLDSEKIEPGKGLKIYAETDKVKELIFDGEIVELEPDFQKASQHLVIRGFDRMHRLSRGRYVRTFLNVTDGDIISKIAKEAGLTSKVGPTTQVHPYVIQANETNLAFLQKRAAGLGYLLFVEGTTLHCVPPKEESIGAELRWAQNMVEFRPRLSTIGQVTEVKARGWDPMQKREVLGQARDAVFVPKVGVGQSGGQYAKKAFKVDAPLLVADRPLRSQAAAEVLAKAVAEMQGGHFIEAEGLCLGVPKLVSGVSVKIQSVGTRFSGSYFVTSATHSFAPEDGYQVRFSVSGLHPMTLLSMMAPTEQSQTSGLSHYYGLVVGIVTDNQDPENLGRVKVMYPWLSSEHTSYWARVVSAGAGVSRGIEFLPEVNDEVLVGFEQGDINHPYVLGGLWNGKDKPPYPSNAAVKGGAVVERTLKSRLGHEIAISDEGGTGGIRLVDIHKNAVTIDTNIDRVRMVSVGNAGIQADKNISLIAEQDIILHAKGRVQIKGDQGVSIGTSSAPTDIKGSVINLN
jgi:phage protein D